MCPRIWPIEDICIGLYVLKRLWIVWYILEKVMSMQHSFEEITEKQRRVELKSVGNFVAKTVFVESANQISLEELCRTQYNMTYFFRSHIDHQTYGKTLINSMGHMRIARPQILAMHACDFDLGDMNLSKDHDTSLVHGHDYVKHILSRFNMTASGKGPHKDFGIVCTVNLSLEICLESGQCGLRAQCKVYHYRNIDVK